MLHHCCFSMIFAGLREGAYVTFDGPQAGKRYSGCPPGVNRNGIPPPVEPKPRLVREVDRERP